MKIHIKLITICFMVNLSGCILTGERFNDESVPYELLWTHPTLSADEAEKIQVDCSDKSVFEAFGVEKFSKLSRDEAMSIIRNNTGKREQMDRQTEIREQCLLDHGFKFHPRGGSFKYPTVCFGDYKKMPGCRSASIF